LLAEYDKALEILEEFRKTQQVDLKYAKKPFEDFLELFQ